MEINRTKMLDYCNLIIKNIEDGGWERYDPTDLRYLSFLRRSSYIRKIFLGLEICIPIKIRKILNIEKKIYPSAYSFVAEAYSVFEKNSIQTIKKQNALDIMEECIEKYVTKEDEEIWWNYGKNSAFYPDENLSGKRPTMPLYFIARCNQALIALGTLYNKSEFIEISSNSLDKTLAYHEIIRIEDDKESICYYYNSRESTINVNTEMLEWMALCNGRGQYTEHIKRILNMVLDEQKEDGSWDYFSKWHQENVEDISGGIDAHHSATVLYNLIHYAELNREGDFHRVVSSIDKGMNFFLDNFFDFKDGKGIVVIGKRRGAGPVQYAESVIALIDYVRSTIDFDRRIKRRAEVLLPKIMKQMLSLVNMEDGSVMSDKVIRRINLNTIRWGNGPVLYAIAKYMEAYQE